MQKDVRTEVYSPASQRASERCGGHTNGRRARATTNARMHESQVRHLIVAARSACLPWNVHPPVGPSVCPPLSLSSSSQRSPLRRWLRAARSIPQPDRPGIDALRPRREGKSAFKQRVTETKCLRHPAHQQETHQQETNPTESRCKFLKNACVPNPKHRKMVS